MTNLHALGRSLSIAWLGTTTLSCLPSDTRPPPGTLLVNAVGSQLLVDGIPASATEDGWSVTYDRFLISIGRAELGGDGCNAYSAIPYSRLLDMKTAGLQKLSLLYGLGACDLSFGISNPDPESVLGEGVTEDDRRFMRTPGMDDTPGVAGASIVVRGTAAREGATKTFVWSFRSFIRYGDCSLTPTSMPLPRFTLEGNQSETANLEIDGQVLLHDNLDGTLAKLRFLALADADTRYGNDDGEIRLDELRNVPLSDVQTTNLYGGMAKGSARWKTLEDYLTMGLVPRMVHLQDRGACSIEEAFGRGEPR